MQDFRCSECGNSEFESAAALLLHFAMHVSQNTLRQSIIGDKGPMTSRRLPDLYPIKNSKDNDLECDSDVNPLKFCTVTMQDTKEKKYICTYCSKRFGWPTDLKRHILIHTGERPFHCQYCDSAFTRNFLLKKHQRKCHQATSK